MADPIYGVTDAGFKIPRLDDIKTDVEASLRATLGNFINLLPSTILGQLVGIYAEREADVWEKAQDVYFSQFIGSATGSSLIQVLAAVGVTKLPATKSIQSGLLLYGTPGAIIPVGTQIRVPGNSSATFQTTSTVQLGAGQDEVQHLHLGAAPDAGFFTLRYINEDTASLPFNATAQNIADALNALDKLGGVTVTGSLASGDLYVQFSGQSGKTPQPNLLVSTNTLTSSGTAVAFAWLEDSTPGVAQGQVNAEALTTGPTSAPLYTLTEIVNPVTGLTSVLNLTDATVGSDLETDNAARVRSKTAQTGRGRGTPDAIVARLKEVSGVSQAIVFQNETDATDANGLPPHSVRAYAQGGADQDILNQLWASKGAGIRTDGQVQGTVTDSAGLSQPVAFSRPQVVPVFASVTVTSDGINFPANGADLVREALEGYVDSLDIGDDVIVYPKMISSLNTIPGLIDVVLKVGLAANPTSDNNLPMAVQQLARVIDPATDIQVTVQ